MEFYEFEEGLHQFFFQSEESDLLEQLALLEAEEQSLTRELEQKQAERRQIGERDEELYRQLRENHRWGEREGKLQKKI